MASRGVKRKAEDITGDDAPVTGKPASSSSAGGSAAVTGRSNGTTNGAAASSSTSSSGGGARREDPRSRSCPYMDTIKRPLLDFDFERVCSVTLSNQVSPSPFQCF